MPRRKVVLVLEDHASVGGLIAGLLRQEGYRAVRAWDPQEALRLARGRAPDLVLLDLNLAYPDGLEVLRQVRELRGDAARADRRRGGRQPDALGRRHRAGGPAWCASRSTST